jgi:hypothetical protein
MQMLATAALAAAAFPGSSMATETAPPGFLELLLVGAAGGACSWQLVMRPCTSDSRQGCFTTGVPSQPKPAHSQTAR